MQLPLSLKKKKKPVQLQNVVAVNAKALCETGYKTTVSPVSDFVVTLREHSILTTFKGK